jgi:hypothetical protein
MKVAPDDKLGVIVFTITTSMAPEIISRDILYRLLGEPNPDEDFPPKGIWKNPHDWPSLCGFYGPKPGFLTNVRLWMSLGGELEIYVNKKNQLAARSLVGPASKGIPLYRMDPKDKLLYRGKFQGGILDGYPVPAVFETDGRGDVTSLYVMQYALYKRPFKQSLKFRVMLVLGWIGAGVFTLVLRKVFKKKVRK